MSSGYLWSMMFNRICDSKVSTVAPVISRHSEIQVVCTQRYVQIIRNRFLRLCGHCCYRKFDFRLRAFCLRKSSSRQDLRWSTWTEVWKRRWHHEVRWVNNCQVGLTKLLIDLYLQPWWAFHVETKSKERRTQCGSHEIIWILLLETLRSSETVRNPPARPGKSSWKHLHCQGTKKELLKSSIENKGWRISSTYV